MLRKTLFSAVMLGAALCVPLASVATGKLASAVVQTSSNSGMAGYDGVVEAVRQTVLASQVSGAIVAIDVEVGDRVRAGQVLLRIDARVADQNALASTAQVQAARSSLALARSELERQRQLHQKKYISQAALERAEAQFHATSAEVTAQLAQADAAHTQSGFFVLKAPYAGVIAEIPVVQGDMALPGRPLLTLYDPRTLRVTATLPQTAATLLSSTPTVKLELPGLPVQRRWPQSGKFQLLPTLDAATHTAQVRVELPAGLTNVTPGMFARVWLPQSAETGQRLFVPASAIVRHAELTAIYVIDRDGQPLLRQVRLGAAHDDVVEILAGVAAGERVALDPQAAARQR